MLYRRQLIRERNALLRKQEIDKQKQAQKEECCRISERRARSASQMRQRKACSETHVPFSTASQCVRKTECTRFIDSANLSSQFDGEIRHRAQIERLKQVEEEKRKVAMETASRHDDQVNRIAEEKELHILETRRLAHEAAHLREEIRRTYQLDSFEKAAKETEIRNIISL
ncbi:hypothetical protein ACTXT7_000312 [Hymenolepis weldensis]